MTAISRREVLLGLSTVGAAGALSGYGTRAAFRDGERFRNELLAGALDLRVDWRNDETGTRGSSDGLVSIDLGELEPRDTGTLSLVLDLPQDDVANNPAYLWLRTFCPSTTGRLADALHVRLSYVDYRGRPHGTPILDGTLCELGEAFRDGLALSADEVAPAIPGEQSCLDTTDRGPLELHLAYVLDPSYTGTGDAKMGLEFAAIACRHATGTENPYATERPLPPCTCRHYHGVSYVAVYACDPDEPGCDCKRLGKFELDATYASCLGVDATAHDENHVAPGRYDLLVDDDCEGTGYDLVIRDTVTKPDGEVVGLAFSVEGDGDRPDPTLCQIEVKGGRGSAFYGPDALRENGTLDYVYAPEKLQ